MRTSTYRPPPLSALGGGGGGGRVEIISRWRRNCHVRPIWDCTLGAVVRSKVISVFVIVSVVYIPDCEGSRAHTRGCTDTDRHTRSLSSYLLQVFPVGAEQQD